MVNRQTPDEIFDESSEPLTLEVTCRKCARTATHAAPWALVHPRFRPGEDDEDGWDGIVLGRIFECPECGAEDEYSLTSNSRLAILARAIPFAGESAVHAKRQRGVRIGIAQLFDGTIVRRPSKALAHSRAVVAERPQSGEAWRRLGNACERYGRASEAEAAWRHALAVDENEFEAAHSLAIFHFDGDGPEAGLPFFAMAIERLPRARGLDAALRRKFADSLVWWLQELLAASDDPIALEAAWPDGTIGRDPRMRLSSVDLRKVTDWHRLEAFLARTDVHVKLTPRLPGATDHTQLQALLDGVDPSEDDFDRPLVGPPTMLATPATPHVRTSPRIGRNDPCPCKSGKKWKKCCANTPAVGSTETRKAG